MPGYDFRTPRLFVDAALAPAAQVALDRGQANYLLNVMRLRAGETVLLFNGRDGEWRAHLATEGRRAALAVSEQTRPQTSPTDLHYLFAPLKAARLDYMVQKAVEMGRAACSRCSRATRWRSVSMARMRANAVEAAEQCGILNLAEIGEPMALAKAIGACEASRLLVFCDEDAEVKDPVAALAAVRSARTSPACSPDRTEGGFTEEERADLMRRPNGVRLALGPRILRADTAAVAALALVGAVLGDWR